MKGPFPNTRERHVRHVSQPRVGGAQRTSNTGVAACSLRQGVARNRTSGPIDHSAREVLHRSLSNLGLCLIETYPRTALAHRRERRPNPFCTSGNAEPSAPSRPRAVAFAARFPNPRTSPLNLITSTFLFNSTRSRSSCYGPPLLPRGPAHRATRAFASSEFKPVLACISSSHCATMGIARGLPVSLSLFERGEFRPLKQRSPFAVSSTQFNLLDGAVQYRAVRKRRVENPANANDRPRSPWSINVRYARSVLRYAFFAPRYTSRLNVAFDVSSIWKNDSTRLS